MIRPHAAQRTGWRNCRFMKRFPGERAPERWAGARVVLDRSIRPPLKATKQRVWFSGKHVRGYGAFVRSILSFPTPKLTKLPVGRIDLGAETVKMRGSDATGPLQKLWGFL